MEVPDGIYTDGKDLYKGWKDKYSKVGLMDFC
jgi:hypothetical protein